MAPADVGRLLVPADPRLSPDGRTVAFAVLGVDLEANRYRSRVWLAEAGAPPRPFTAGAERDSRPRFSPDGRTLAFVSGRDGEGDGLYLLPVATGGEAVRVAGSPEAITAVEWSPDGALLAYVTRVRNEERYGAEKAADQPPRVVTHLFSRLDDVGWTFDRPARLFVVPADASALPRALSPETTRDVGGFAWSPDSTRIVFAAPLHDTWEHDLACDLHVVAVTGGEPERITRTGPHHAKPSWSPDGELVACKYERDPLVSPVHAQVAVVPAGGGDARVLTGALDRYCVAGVSTAREPVWDGDELLFQVEDAGSVHLYRVPASGDGKPEVMLGGRRWVRGFDHRAGTLAFTADEPTATAEVFLAGPDPTSAGGEVQLTGFGRHLSAEVGLVAPERFTAVSPDGTEVEAWVMAPAGAEPGGRHPALLNIHGGPFTQYGWTFFDEFQVQAGAGYAVVFCNPRGSSGYSEAWGQAVRGPLAEQAPGTGWGSVDFDDVMAVVDEAIARFDFVDGERLGVLGGSYGGYLTTWTVTQTDRFRAACSERACNNLLSLEWASDIATVFRTYVGPSHLDAPEEYLRQSPITRVREIRTPMLLVHSEDDLRCPIEQAEQLFVALRMLGREVELVRFPGESHELSRSGAPRHRVQRAEIILDFFDRHLR